MLHLEIPRLSTPELPWRLLDPDEAEVSPRYLYCQERSGPVRFAAQAPHRFGTCGLSCVMDARQLEVPYLDGSSGQIVNLGLGTDDMGWLPEFPCHAPEH